MFLSSFLDTEFFQIVLQGFEHIAANADEVLDSLCLQLGLAGGSPGNHQNGLVAEDRQELDALWSECNVGSATTLGLIPLGLSGQTYSENGCREVFHFIVPDETVEAIRRAYEDVFGEGNVWVSKQVVTSKTLVRDWEEFDEQAHSRLIAHDNYWRHRYDTQEFTEGEPFLPFFGIPV